MLKDFTIPNKLSQTIGSYIRVYGKGKNSFHLFYGSLISWFIIKYILIFLIDQVELTKSQEGNNIGSFINQTILNEML